MLTEEATGDGSIHARCCKTIGGDAEYSKCGIRLPIRQAMLWPDCAICDMAVQLAGPHCCPRGLGHCP